MQLKIQSLIGDNELKIYIYISFESDPSRSSLIEVTSPTVSDRAGAHEKITAKVTLKESESTVFKGCVALGKLNTSL